MPTGRIGAFACVNVHILIILVVGLHQQNDWGCFPMESEPSIGSTSQIHVPSPRGPETALTLCDIEGIFTNVNKGKIMRINLYKGCGPKFRGNSQSCFCTTPGFVQPRQSRVKFGGNMKVLIWHSK